MTPAGAVYTIPPGLSFVDSLASGLLARARGDPTRLADITVFLPTRRACRALTEAFLRQADGAALLPPVMTPIGDIDDAELATSLDGETPSAGSLDVPPAISDLRRQLLLTRLIVTHRARTGDTGISPDQAARLAEELARFLDQVQTERLPFDNLAGLVPEEYADHWRITLDFLKIVTDHWPAILAAAGCIDPAERRNRLVEAQIQRWRSAPPPHPIVVAGSTGSVPATADLISEIAALPNGMVVLPGIDRSMDRDAVTAMTATHPQFTMVRLLARIGIGIDDVADWGEAVPDQAIADRAGLLSLAMRPPGTGPVSPDPEAARQATEGVRRVDCASPQEEAGVIALALRQALETPGRTAALVTPDRGLARRVAAELRRWDVEIDDSAGVPLGDTPPGTFLRLTAEMIAEHAAPVPLLSCLKHPLAAGGMDPAAFRGRVRALEIAVLRGPRPEAGLKGISRALGDAGSADHLATWIDGISARAEMFRHAMGGTDVPLTDLVAAHVAFAEFLAGTESQPGAERLWRGEAGEQAARLVRDLHDASSSLGAVAGAAYPALLDTLIRLLVVRPRYGRHPRLHIWGPLEARLQQADLLILGGLNEGAWPPDPAPDPWMSRPMRSRFGLPPPERRVGLSAHDFAQAFAAPEVMLTRATRVEGTPSVPSRWLLRLDNVLEAAGQADALRRDAPQWLRWHQALDRPPLREQVLAPHACPPVSARPRKLSVTQIETLIRDPYAIYARHVLRLRPLEPIDADPAAAERGTAIHDALDRFLHDFPDALTDDALPALLAIGEAAFGPMLDRPGVRAFWWPRFVRIAEWFVDQERHRRAGLRAIHSEVTGTTRFDAPGGPFVLTGKADRIDEHEDGGLEVIDYKTGSVPRVGEIKRGFSPQLPLEAVILADGGFPGIGAVAPWRLAIWHLTGGNPAAEEKAKFTDGLDQLITEVRAGVHDLIARYDDPETPYLPRPIPDHQPPRSDYDHLARVGEWASTDGDGQP